VFLESSKDILYLVLAFCILWFTAFVCWMLYYVIGMLKDASETVRSVRDKLHAIDEAIRGVKEKLDHSASYLGMVAGGVKLAISYLEKHKEKVAEKAQKAAEKLGKKVKKAKKRFDEAMDDEDDEE
jgi:biopolymer transport protein ExbB/TolQ